ncbi:MAG: hypothetical protein NTV11_17660 [Rhodocyclales bacterium]|nr:hypothetical protein [Rhodocyclales bacterium]
MKYRPWGSLDWALSLSSPKRWHFVGAIGTEERSLCGWTEMRRLGAVADELFAEIQDVDSEKYRDRTQVALQARRAEFTQNGGNLAKIRSFRLMVEWFQIAAFAREAEVASQSLVLDISSFPKRFFFPILRALVTSTNVLNLLVTYTSPASYADDAPLYENIEPWKTLPGFGGVSSKPELWIVSVGFLVESLRHYVGGNPEEKMKVLIPFPAPLAALRRTWQSVAELEKGHSDGRFDKYRVDPLDMSAAFDRIDSLAGNPPKNLAFAPFGPKPTSAAMCLYALQRESSVHYPQPTVYHPEYSTGIRNNDPTNAVSAYWVKHEGELLYSL